MDNTNITFNTVTPQNVNTQPIDDAQNIPSDHGKSYHSLILQRATIGLSEADREKFIGQILDRNSSVLSSASLIFTQRMSCSDRIELVDFFEKIESEDQCRSVAEISVRLKVLPFADMMKCINDIKNIVTLEAASETILSLFTAIDITKSLYNMLYSDVSLCLEKIRLGIDRIPQEERESIMMHTLQVVTNVELTELCSILEAVAQIPANNRASIIEPTSKLITNEMSGNNRIRLLITVAKINVEDRTSVVEQTLRLLTDEMDPLLCSDLHQKIAKIQDANPIDCDSRVEEATRFALNRDADERWNVLYSVSRLKASDRTSVVEHTCRLITREMFFFDRRLLLNEIAEIDPADRTSVVEHTGRLVSGTTDVDSRDLLLALADMTPADRIAVVNHSQIL